jgi:hypothetical protein
MFAAPTLAAKNRALFLPIISTWGWGTWQRAWKAFDPRATGWEQLSSDRRLRRQFNFGGIYDYSVMLERQMRGAIDSWGIRWYWSVFRHNGLCCYPPQSFVCNTGMDGSGTHGRGTLRGFSKDAQMRVPGEIIFPAAPITSEDDLNAVRQAIWVQNGGWLGHGVDRLRALRWAITKYMRA